MTVRNGSARGGVAERALLAPLRVLFPPGKFLLRKEVPFQGKSIDALFLDCRTRRLVAIELKVRKWRKALRQAAVYQLGAHQVYVALWHRHLNDERAALIRRHGVGVIEIGEGPRRRRHARILARPGRAAYLNRRYAHELRGHFE